MFNSSLIGENAVNPALMPIAHPFAERNVASTALSSSVLRSAMDPLEIAAQPVFPRILQVSEADIQALAQVIKEAHEQCLT